MNLPFEKNSAFCESLSSLRREVQDACSKVILFNTMIYVLKSPKS
jgi:hypothetical protein